MAENPVKGAAGDAGQTAAEKQLIGRRQVLDYWQKNAASLRRRNLVTGLAIGAFVVGMCILRPFPVSIRGHDHVMLYSLKIYRFFFLFRVKQFNPNVIELIYEM